MWAWMLDYYGDSSLATYMRANEEFGGDAFWCCGPATPSYIHAWPDEYNLPEVRVHQRRYQDGDYTIVERTFHTPGGPLTDKVKIPPPRSRWGMAPDPVIVEHLVKTREDFDRLPYLLPPVATDMSEYHRCEEIIGDRGVTELYVLGPLDQRAADARGMEQLMMDYYDDREFFDAQLDLAHDQMMRETRAALEGGVKIIFGSWFYESLSAGWSPAIWREVFLPRLKQHVELVHSAGALYHFYDDGKIQQILGMLAEAEVDIVSTCTPPPVGDFDLAAAKRGFGDKLCFKGYVDLLYVVKMGTPELVEASVREAMEIGKPGGGFILGSSDSFREGTPVENVRAYFEAARKYGVYR
jgi:uroporphyrinogen decarboxylase